MRLTIAQKHKIADSAVSAALEQELRHNAIDLEEQASSIVNRETADFKEILDTAPEGFFVEAESIVVTVDGDPEPLPLPKRQRVPHSLLTGEIEFGEGTALYQQLSGALTERSQLDRTFTRMKADLMNEILVPATSLSGLVKKWPNVVEHLPRELKRELKHLDRVEEILTRKEDD